MTNDEKYFTDWLITHTSLKKYSIGRYADAIDIISSELEYYGLEKIDLFKVSDPNFINRILDNPKFQKKNQKGNRMYSAALKHLKNYIEYYNDKELQTELLKEEFKFEKYINDNFKNAFTRKIEDKPRNKPKFTIVNNQKVWIRNPRYATDVLVNEKYLCEYNSEHKFFISKFSKENYVEAHHLIPMKYQEEFDCSLDVYANIISLCLVCHKKLHYGLFKDKKEILGKLFSKRKGRLKASGIDVDINKIYSYYTD